MVPCFHCINTQAHLHLLLSVLLLTSIQVRNSAEGRQALNLLEIKKDVDGKKMLVVGTMIGSRPPRCESICAACSHCVAVQVPAVSQERSGAGNFFTAITRGDDSSTYKPMDWKCKCGGTILNP